MGSLNTGALPSMRKQQLYSEFAGLKQAHLEGVFVSLAPGDPTMWSGVLFVRDGPYSPAVLRFQISFPDAYPQFPPLVTFSTDIFHPLITPLTTYMYTTDIQDSGTVSASDQERLPPGGFSLRHGFPQWFGRGRRNVETPRQVSGQQAATPTTGQVGVSNSSTPASKTSPGVQVPIYMQTDRKTVSAYEILRYIRDAFNSEKVLDMLPLEAAGNPGAWHAWRTHRRAAGKLPEEVVSADDVDKQDGEDAQGLESGSEKRASPTGSRHPGEWNWDGVWEDRVKKGIAASLSEPVLYGSVTTPDDLLRFLAMEDNDVESVKENIRRTLGSAS